MNEWLNYGKNLVLSFGTKGVSVKGTVDQRRLLTIDQLEVDAETKTLLKLTIKQVSYDSSRTGCILFLFIYMCFILFLYIII